jgi:hypothetical protein
MLILGAGSSAQAEPLCYNVLTSGTVLGYHTIFTKCIAYPDATICQTETAGLSPSALVTVEACIPAPLLAGDSESAAGSA